jgi:hypothetical protein
MEQATALPAALHSPAAEAWQVEFAKMLPELERLSKYVAPRRCYINQCSSNSQAVAPGVQLVQQQQLCWPASSMQTAVCNGTDHATAQLTTKVDAHDTQPTACMSQQLQQQQGKIVKLLHLMHPTC